MKKTEETLWLWHIWNSLAVSLTSSQNYVLVLLGLATSPNGRVSQLRGSLRKARCWRFLTVNHVRTMRWRVSRNLSSLYVCILIMVASIVSLITILFCYCDYSLSPSFLGEYLYSLLLSSRSRIRTSRSKSTSRSRSGSSSSNNSSSSSSSSSSRSSSRSSSSKQ